MARKSKALQMVEGGASCASTHCTGAHSHINMPTHSTAPKRCISKPVCMNLLNILNHIDTTDGYYQSEAMRQA
jgi:hypothetical protein